MATPKNPNKGMPVHYPNLQMPSPKYQPQPTLNPDQFDAMITTKGIRMIHARPIPCPNRRTIHGSDHDPACSLCYNGFLYYGHKQFTGTFMGNDNSRTFNMQGSWDVSNVQIIIPTKYDDGTDIDLQVYDQIVVPDFTVRYFQLVEYNQSGIDRLHFPATSIDKVIDSRFQEYFSGVDFAPSTEGHLQWISQNRPGYDLTIDKGVIYSVNYYAKAAFTVLSLPHQLRITQSMDPDGVVRQHRFPQLVVCRKNFIPYDPNDTIGPSDSPEPKNGQT